MEQKVRLVPMVDAKAKLLFIVLHLVVLVFAAVFAGLRPAVAVLVISVLAALRYLSMAFLSGVIGRSGFLSLLAGAFWMGALAALVAALYAIGRSSRSALPWAAAAALAGPFCAMIVASTGALLALVRRFSPLRQANFPKESAQ